MRWRVATAALALAACVRGAADHEALGDERYVGAAYRDAVAEYRLALTARPDEGGLLAKLGAAALHAGELSEAISAYRSLATHADFRDEGLIGLWRVVRAATEANERGALLDALRAIRDVDPDQRLGRYAVRAALDEIAAGTAGEALELLPYAAAAVDGRLADSLLFAYAELTASAGRCGEASGVYEALLRRARAPEILDAVRAGQARCALREGRAALQRGEPQAAEQHFRRAASPLAPLSIARAAWLGLGDVRVALGDFAAAVEAYEQARAGLPPEVDSIARVAAARLRAIGNAETRRP